MVRQIYYITYRDNCLRKHLGCCEFDTDTKVEIIKTFKDYMPFLPKTILSLVVRSVLGEARTLYRTHYGQLGDFRSSTNLFVASLSAGL